ncbi:MAG: hypothetical protein MNSN_07220 [Minisyncoccus archaeiphilus]|uniref:M28 family peptidase n=1 Tax=Minisyncoccus archaeiphilus TaxID=3238481 RepID=UPI002B11D56B|nr:MAG: hypothetical protein MNSN_07220 [Candidatus Parcubacteria bacterium]
MEKFNKIEFVSKLISLGERQGEKESEAADIIINTLGEAGHECTVQEFKTTIPQAKECHLSADKLDIKCKATAFVSGDINGKSDIVSSLIPSRYLIEYSNINFNPLAGAISKSNYYFAPSMAVDNEGLKSILEAKDVAGKVEIIAKEHISKNILVGDITHPRRIYIAHYDSVEKGATDNASGVAVLMDMIISGKCNERDLIIFSGNEELSYNKPTYWGEGFRAFEAEYMGIMEEADKIIIVDCVGNGKTIVSEDNHIKYLAFPINNLEYFQSKIIVVHGDMDKVMKVYHSEDDDINQLDELFMDEAVDVVHGIDLI